MERNMDLKQAESLLRPEVEDDIVADDCVASAVAVARPGLIRECLEPS